MLASAGARAPPHQAWPEILRLLGMVEVVVEEEEEEAAAAPRQRAVRADPAVVRRCVDAAAEPRAS
jgi:hypothetical protein